MSEQDNTTTKKVKKIIRVRKVRTPVSGHKSPPPRSEMREEEKPLVEERLEDWDAYLTGVYSLFKGGEVVEALKEIESEREKLQNLLDGKEGPKDFQERVHHLLGNAIIINELYLSITDYENLKLSLELAKDPEKLEEPLLLQYKKVEKAIQNINTFAPLIKENDDALDEYMNLQRKLGFNYSVEKEKLEVLQNILGGALAFLTESEGYYHRDSFLEYIFLPLCEEKGFADKDTEKIVKNIDQIDYLTSVVELTFYDDGSQELKGKNSMDLKKLKEEKGLDTHTIARLIELENYPDELVKEYNISLEDVYRKHLNLTNSLYDVLIQDSYNEINELVKASC